MKTTEKTIEKIKKCPFCGCEPSLVMELRREKGINEYVKCGKCKARGPEVRNKEIAIRAWNTRKGIEK